MSDGAILGLAVLLVVVGIGGAAYILRWEIRYQRRVRRHGGFLLGGER